MSDNSSRFSKDYKAAKTPKSKPTEKGTVIYDPRGQWDHPGQITKIPGGNITMQDVNYPVLGVDNFGNQQMMYPGMDYTFPNADNVTEYPQMSKGGMYTGKGTPRKSTSQNIQTSINPLMTRNTTLFGPGGKHLFRPSMQIGGASETVNQPQQQNPYLKAAIQNRADKINNANRQAYEDQVRARVRAQQKLTPKKQYDEDFEVQAAMKEKQYTDMINSGTEDMMFNIGAEFLPVVGQLSGAKYLNKLGSLSENILESDKIHHFNNIQEVQNINRLEKYGLKNGVNDFPAYQRKLDEKLIKYNDHYGTDLNIKYPEPTHADRLTGSTDIPSFNEQINQFKNQVEFGNRPLEKKIGPNVNLFNQEDMDVYGADMPQYWNRNGVPYNIHGFEPNSLKPYTGKIAYSNLTPNKLGGQTKGWLDKYQEGGGTLPKDDATHHYTDDVKDYATRARLFSDSLNFSVQHPLIPKPTQQVIYRPKPQVKVEPKPYDRIYTDEAKYNKANQMYNDSSESFINSNKVNNFTKNYIKNNPNATKEDFEKLLDINFSDDAINNLEKFDDGKNTNKLGILKNKDGVKTDMWAYNVKNPIEHPVLQKPIIKQESKPIPPVSEVVKQPIIPVKPKEEVTNSYGTRNVNYQSEPLYWYDKKDGTKQFMNKDEWNQQKMGNAPVKQYGDGGKITNSPYQDEGSKMTAQQWNESNYEKSLAQARREIINDYVEKGFNNTVNNPVFKAVASLTPIGMGVGAIEGAANLVPDIYKGDYGKAGIDVLQMTPMVGSNIKNAYKLNPWAFKPNPEAYYRALGKETNPALNAGYQDAIGSNSLRVNQNPDWMILDQGNMPSPYFMRGDNFEGIKQYKPGIIAEVTNQPMKTRGFSNLANMLSDKPVHSVYQPVKEVGEMGKGLFKTKIVEKMPNIPLGENTKFYKEDWLKGYKEVPKKFGNGGTNKGWLEKYN